MLKNFIVKLPEKAARWARVRATERNMSPSRMIGALVKAEMKQDAVSTKAYQRWKAIDSILGIDAERRLGREEAHKRGR